MLDSYQKERMLLGAVMCEPKECVKLLAGMDEDCFTDENKAVYRRIAELSAQGKPIDPTMVAEGLVGVDSVAMINLCVAMMREGSPWNAKQYAKDLRELGRRRKAWKLMRSCADNLEGDEDLQTVVDQCRDGLRKLSSARGDVTYMADVASQLMDRLDAVASGSVQDVKSGLPALDSLISGFSNGDMVIVGARPAVGKSAFGMALALNAARAGKKVLVCSLEMSAVQYAQRIASEITGISSVQLKRADLDDRQWDAIGQALNEMSRMDVGFTFSVRTVEDLYSLCLHEKDTRGLDLLVVDYIQLLDTKKRVDNDVVKLTHISNRIKALALELQIPVIALAQVKRQEGTQLRMPTLQELRGSGSLEMDADKVIFLHRVETPGDAYCRSSDALRRFQQEGDQMVAVEVAKHRDGPTGSFCTRFETRRMRYTCLTHREDA